MKWHILTRTFAFILSFMCVLSNGMAFDPNMSEADMMALQEQINAEIEAEVAKMSPEEQEMFFQVMNNIEELAENDPEMLERFITGQMDPSEEEAFVSAMVPADEAPKQEEKPVETKKPTEPEKKEEPKQVSTQSQETVIEIVDGIIKQTETFLATINTIPDAALKINNWGKARKISNWQASFSWALVRDEINALVSTLRKVQEGPAAGDKKAYINAIAQSESLKNNLAQTKRALDQHVPKVIVSSFGIDPLDKNARNAARAVLTAHIEAIHSLAIPKELDDLFKKQEPELKKLKERQEAAEKEATRRAQQPRRTESLKSAGREEREAQTPSYGTRGDFAAGSGYGGYSPSYGGYSPSYVSGYSPTSSSRGPSDRFGASRGGASAAPSETRERSRRDRKIEPTSQSSTSKTKEPVKREFKKDKKTPVLDRAVERKIGLIEDQFEIIKDAIKDAKHLPEIAPHLKDAKQPADTEFAQQLLSLEQAIENARDQIQSLSKRTKKDKNRGEVKKAIEKAYDKFKDDFDAVKKQAQIVVNQNLAVATSQEKNKAYLAPLIDPEQVGIDEQEKERRAKQKAERQTGSIFEVEHAFKGLKQSIDDFGKSK